MKTKQDNKEDWRTKELNDFLKANPQIVNQIDSLLISNNKTISKEVLKI
jgi:hypothetical protein